MNPHIARPASVVVVSVLISLSSSASNLPEALGFDASMEGVDETITVEGVG